MKKKSVMCGNTERESKKSIGGKDLTRDIIDGK